MSPRASHRSGGARVARLAIVLAACLAVLAGCRTRADVDVALQANGSGTVTVSVVIDAAAAAKVGDLSKVLALDDLTKSGWKVAGPGRAPTVLSRFVRSKQVPEARGKVPATSVALVLWRPFDNVEQANAIVKGISGPAGPLRDVHFTRSSSFASTKLTAKGQVDLSGGLDSFGDADLTKALGGTSLSELAAQANGGPEPDDASLVVGFAVQPSGFTFSSDKGDFGSFPYPQSTDSLGSKQGGGMIDVVGSQRHTTALVLAALAALAVLGALALTLVPLLPGREPPPPSKRKRQHHSATDGWQYVAGREGSGLDPRAAKRAHSGRRGSHRRARGAGMPAWKLDEITVNPDEQVVTRPIDDRPGDGEVTDGT